MKQSENVHYYVILSIISILMLLLMAYFGNTDNNLSVYNKEIVVMFLIISFIFGISLALRPSWYKNIINRNKTNRLFGHKNKSKIKLKGHHPDCNKFQNHVIKIKDKTLCTGCFGLAFGCAISILLTVCYYVFGNITNKTTSYLLIFIGFIIIFLANIEIMISKRNKFIHITLNILLIIGFFLITISVFEITNNLLIALFSIIFSYLWLTTRVNISIKKHKLICSNCSNTCKVY